MPFIQTVAGTPSPSPDDGVERMDEQELEGLLDPFPDAPSEGIEENTTDTPPSPPTNSTSTRPTLSTIPTTPLSSPHIAPISPPSTPSTPVSFPQGRQSTSTPQRAPSYTGTGAAAAAGTSRYEGVAPRRPNGWISSLSSGARGYSGDSVLQQQQRATSVLSQGIGTGEKKARVSSVAFGGVEGRRVSGAMKYTLRGSAGSSGEPRVGGGRIVSTTSAQEFDLSQQQFDLAAASADSPVLEGREDEDVESMGLGMGEKEEENMRYEVFTAQEQDELWMAHVREQLNTLFPDFFAAEPGGLGDLAGLADDMAGRFKEDDDDRGDKSVGSVRVRDVEHEGDQAEERSFTTSASATTSSSLNPQTPPPTGLPRSISSSLPGRQVSRGRGSFGVPNVREEITDLREEIMRLRSVVGGLAEGLRAEYAAEVVAIEREGKEAEPEPKQQGQGQGQGQGQERMMQVPESYVRTANKSIEILIHLDTLVRDPVPAITTNSKTSCAPETAATRTLEMRDINAVFEEQNLARILEFVKGLGSVGVGEVEGKA
ncbi:hypothetical protein IAR50_007223 [Cryptococcus sp. DSM 104548]